MALDYIILIRGKKTSNKDNQKKDEPTLPEDREKAIKEEFKLFDKLREILGDCVSPMTFYGDRTNEKRYGLEYKKPLRKKIIEKMKATVDPGKHMEIYRVKKYNIPR